MSANKVLVPLCVAELKRKMQKYYNSVAGIPLNMCLIVLFIPKWDNIEVSFCLCIIFMK